MSDHDDGFSLVMPFVVCESEGGPYVDQSFVAGWECAQMDSLLAHAAGARDLTLSVRAASLPQLDLIAMRRGFVMLVEPDTDERSWIICKPAPWAPDGVRGD